MEISNRQSGSSPPASQHSVELHLLTVLQNAELVTLTYGSIVQQLCKDLEGDYAEVNKQLDKMGYNIGLRLIEDFLAKTNTGRCANFRDTAETIAKARSLLLLLLIVFRGPCDSTCQNRSS